MTAATPATQSHGGILFPLDMFRPTILAQALAEVLIGKVRNIVDATVEIARLAPLLVERPALQAQQLVEAAHPSITLALAMPTLVAGSASGCGRPRMSARRQ